jgi:hypothetical protein
MLHKEKNVQECPDAAHKPNSGSVTTQAKHHCSNADRPP